jgi:hypothetical protein
MNSLTHEEVQLILAALNHYHDYLAEDYELFPESQKVEKLLIKIERGL